MDQSSLLSKLSEAAPAQWRSAQIKDSDRVVRWLPVADLQPKQLLVGLSEQGNWILQIDEKTVVEYSPGVSLWFLLPCLEQPYSHVVSLIQRGLDQAGLDREICELFPFAELVCVGLTARSAYWTGLAIDWLQHMPVCEEVARTLKKVIEEKLTTQKLTHKAQLLLNSWHRRLETNMS